MEWWHIVLSVVLLVLMTWILIHDIRKELKEWRNQAPDGKDFIKNFSKALLDIRYCQQMYKNKGIKDNKQYIDFSASIENCLNDYYKNGGAPIKDFSPNMFLDKTSLEQWIEMIKKQPILY